jgi:hypothetical protein
MGDRAIPEGNPILVEKERKRLRQVHLSRLRKTRPTIDTSLPKGFSKKKGGGLIRKKNLKREQQMEERYSSIERENRRLLEKMSSVMTSKTLDNKLAAKYRHFNTVNGPARKRLQDKIRLDNAHNRKLINNTEAFYQTKVWEVERAKMEKQIIYFCTITAGRKGRVIAPLIKRGKTRRRRRKRKKKRPNTVAAPGNRNARSLLEPLGRTFGRPTTTGPNIKAGRKSKSHSQLTKTSFTKEELEWKLKEVEKRYEKWQDAANTTPLQGETMLEVSNTNENEQIIKEDSNSIANGQIHEHQKTKEQKEIVFHNKLANDEIVDDNSALIKNEVVATATSSANNEENANSSSSKGKTASIDENLTGEQEKKANTSVVKDVSKLESKVEIIENFIVEQEDKESNTDTENNVGSENLKTNNENKEQEEIKSDI